MRILIDIGHPGHVHLFKNFARLMTEKGHQVHFTVRDKEFEVALLDHYRFKFTKFGKHFRSKPGKLLGLVKFTWLMIVTARKFRADLFLSHGSIYAAFAAYFLRKPNIALEDTGNLEQVRLYLPFTRAVLTSCNFQCDYGDKQIRYDGYHELAYLHPNHFRPDPSILEALSVGEGQKYFILRFVSWNASHDVGQSGIGYEEKKQLVDLLLRYGKVFISSEKTLEPELDTYRFSLPPERMHDALAYATLFIGEGATMASECAMLGTPAIYVNTMEAGTIDEQERYGLITHLRSGAELSASAVQLLEKDDLKSENKQAREKMLREKIDVTAFLVWFIENLPESLTVVRENPLMIREKFTLNSKV